MTTPRPGSTGVWECRYFCPVLPASLSRRSLAALLGGAAEESHERDTYVLASGARVNVKVRLVSGDVKLKRLLEREDDGFELWRTDAESHLPASRETWAAIASALSLGPDTTDLAVASDPEEALAALRKSSSAARFVDIVKDRTSFAVDHARVEVATVSVVGASLRSVAFESAELAAARELHARLVHSGLDTPENYVELCWRMLASRPV